MKEAVIVSAVRTPLGNFNGSLSSVGATDLGALVIEEAIKRAGISKESVNEAIMGQVLPCGYGQNPAKQAAVKAGLPWEVECITVNKVCGSSLKAVMLAAQSVQLGDAEIVVAGGMENMSQAPYFLPNARFGQRLGNGKLLDLLMTDFDGLDLRGVKVAVDCANGAASGLGPALFAELGAEVTALCDRPDGRNINEGCGSTAPAETPTTSATAPTTTIPPEQATSLPAEPAAPEQPPEDGDLVLEETAEGFFGSPAALGGGDAESSMPAFLAGEITNMGPTEIGYVTNFASVNYTWDRIEIPGPGLSESGWMGELDGRMVAVSAGMSDGAQALVTHSSDDGLAWEQAGSGPARARSRPTPKPGCPSPTCPATWPRTSSCRCCMPGSPAATGPAARPRRSSASAFLGTTRSAWRTSSSTCCCDP